MRPLGQLLAYFRILLSLFALEMYIG